MHTLAAEVPIDQFAEVLDALDRYVESQFHTRSTWRPRWFYSVSGKPHEYRPDVLGKGTHEDPALVPVLMEATREKADCLLTYAMPGAREDLFAIWVPSRWPIA
jgi:hypothetical protein